MASYNGICHLFGIMCTGIYLLFNLCSWYTWSHQEISRKKKHLICRYLHPNGLAYRFMSALECVISTRTFSNKRIPINKCDTLSLRPQYNFMSSYVWYVNFELCWHLAKIKHWLLISLTRFPGKFHIEHPDNRFGQGQYLLDFFFAN